MTRAGRWRGGIAVAGAVILLAGCTSGGGTDRTGPDMIDCSRFAAFLDQPTLPAGATDATCTFTGWQDDLLTAEFDLATLPPLESWLAELPASEPLHQERHDDVVQYTQIHFRPRLDGGADALDVSAVQSADGFHVTMSAFNV
jgi:hypothetical protein